MSPKKAKVDASDETKKQQLISNLKKYCGKLNLSLPAGIITDRNIINYEAGDHGKAKCLFSCPFCVKRIPLTFDFHWKSANATTHLKNHIQNQNKHNESVENVIVDL